MSPSVIAIVGLAASLGSVAGVAIGLARWIRKQFEPIVNELSSNGGNSTKDKVEALIREFVAHKHDTAQRFDTVDSHLDRQDRRIDGLYQQRLIR